MSFIMCLKLSRIMSGIECVVFLMVLICQGIRGDTEVSCVFMESCMLPCSFQGGTDADIDWSLAKPSQALIYSYYFSQDELTQQDQRFRGRTSLFKDQITNGNASLRLTKVEVQDEGRYTCHTSTNHGTQDSFINLKVNAPVLEVNIEKVGNRITCSSEGIYPEPVLTWSTGHPSIFKSTTIVQRSGQLYSINSSLMPPNDFTDLTYSCNVSTRSNSRTAILSNSKQKESVAIVMVVGVIMVAVILGLIPMCCNKMNKAQWAPEPADISNQPNLLLTENSPGLLMFSINGDHHEGDPSLQSAAAEPTEI